MFPANWIRQITGADPAHLWRGRYDDEAGAFRFMKEAGGLVRTFERGARSIGLVPSCAGQVGAVGVIANRMVRGRRLGAIALGNGLWVCQAAGGGFHFSRARAFCAWWVI